MARYAARRLLLTLPLLVGISLVSFLGIQLAPGGPISVATDLNPKATAEYRERLKAYFRSDIIELQRLIGRDLSAWL